MSDHGEQPQRWFTTNLVGVPAGVLASAAFNAYPQALHVSGAREGNRGLFALLARCATPEAAREVFEHYMTVAFGLARPAGDAPAHPERRRWRSSYLKLLQGWGLDANGPAGAVLKGWVESRFGLVPAFHGAPLAHFPSPAWVAYLEQKAASRYHNNSIFQQLDLLFEFCQWMLARFALLGDGTHATLWRGSRDCEAQVVAGSLRARRCTVRLNNLVSFTRERETAECFGDWVMRARVPLAKLLLVPGLLATSSLSGEAEVLALGGDYEVEVSYGP
ncbi:MAG: NAD(+)--dinitrogen-reductase ADP-D-ribosyltransferase [Piscinibacter sp.]|uniref:NAD(+)--dinitrogen-reductase ADP-D-ribosyltransferase n=1 Tax=Piscinibacter sp. TaxID=1903157 RepID=UPI002584D292|nr:NAD(+)--dinitrogen-reductase ADP-D-ribosyltransferase [Piscinibacter sp.]MCW5666323.1 NAD(+)--dinitrogen-reductase ADP-D-ribosyltransferase [Piscinibacter sp.]